MTTLRPTYRTARSFLARRREAGQWQLVPRIDKLRLILAVAVAWIMKSAIRGLHIGAASVLPGEAAVRIHPRILPLLCSQISRGVILIAGTNGKTTTALLLRTILERHGYRIVHNVTGANLENGLVAALLDHTRLDGRVDADYAIFEVDENILPRVAPRIRPQVIVCLNLFRDQLDRYGEVDTVMQRWMQAISPLPSETMVIINGDDPKLSYLGRQLKQRVLSFGLSEPELFIGEMPHAADSVYCPRCGQRLEYRGVYLSHLGDFDCSHCGFQRVAPSLESRAWQQALPGVYNKYNTLAAVLTAQVAGGEDTRIREALTNFQAAFGRAEELEVRGKCTRILLSKNPAGMNETIRLLQAEVNAGHTCAALLVLNDRIPDGTDVSWIWDVDTEKLAIPGMTLVISGDRAYDMALRLEYSGARTAGSHGCELIVKQDLREAILTALAHTEDGQTLHILPTYSAMLEVRELVVGRQIL